MVRVLGIWGGGGLCLELEADGWVSVNFQLEPVGDWRDGISVKQFWSWNHVSESRKQRV